MGDFLMPSLGADMEHGKIVEWLVKPGDYVRRGDLVAVVDTDKTVMDVESFQEGGGRTAGGPRRNGTDRNTAGPDHSNPG
ncbi:biotin/lipoyl-binding protein [Arthrobacter sp. OVS8]|nr:biotin/lipoyl-binding protein [Arthrobacter sp. OVS8]